MHKLDFNKSKSALYMGWIRHRRFAPKRHEFRYPLFMVFLDLKEHESKTWLGAWARKRIKREDHFGNPLHPLENQVREEAAKILGYKPTGCICLLTHARQFGYVFNPVSFFYVMDEAGKDVAAIIAEVHNTPWNETHLYAMQKRVGEHKPVWTFQKAFHVSPFMGVGQTYKWRLSDPDENLTVHMENDEEGVKVFDATLILKRKDFTRSQLVQTQLRYPFMSLRVIAGIYFQAFKLWLKRVPIQNKPAKEPREAL
jgi:DUF1365 family protein